MAWRTREFPKLFGGGAYPPNTLLIVDRLVKEEFLIEVSTVAALYLGLTQSCENVCMRPRAAGLTLRGTVGTVSETASCAFREFLAPRRSRSRRRHAAADAGAFGTGGEDRSAGGGRSARRRPANRAARRRLLLGHPGGVPAHQGRHQGRVRLCRRRQEDARATTRQHRPHQPRRGRAGDVRPEGVSYGKLLQVFFSVAHNPTELNRQGPDTGPQYRTEIFPQTEEQAKVAKAYIAQLDAAKSFPAPIVTKTGTMKAAFYPAEAYHQDYATRHPSNPYIVFNDAPKVENLKRDVRRPVPRQAGAGRRRRARRALNRRNRTPY